MKYVYVYLDPETGVVRYVGSGAFERLHEHTKPSQLHASKNESPFFRWLKEQGEIDWSQYRFRIVGPVTSEIAEVWEDALIRKHFGTVLNVRAASNGCELRPAIHPKHGPRSESGYRQARRTKLGWKGRGGNAGRGICRHGPSWRVTVIVEGKQVRKTFRLYCDALKWRKQMEQITLGSL